MRPRLRLRSAQALALLAMAFECGPALAHLESTGMGPVYDGVLHFLTSPEDLVPALALAMLAGLRGATYARRAMFTLPVAWLLGGLAGLSAASASAGPLATVLWLVLPGGLVVADAKLSLRAMTVLGALLGLVQGYLNGTTWASPERPWWPCSVWPPRCSFWSSWLPRSSLP